MTVPQICSCPGCDKSINRNYVHGRPQLYCTIACRKRHVKLKDKEMKIEAIQKGLKESTGMCLYHKCNEPFKKEKRTQKFCCIEHRVLHNNEKRYLIEKKDNFENICHYTGKKFMSNRSTARFISDSAKTRFSQQYRSYDMTTIGENYFNDDIDFLPDLINEIFIDCEFTDINFSLKDFTNARFIRCDFYNCNFSQAEFTSVYLEDVTFHGFNNFDKTNISLTKFPSDTNINVDTCRRSGIKVNLMRQDFRDKTIRKMETYND